MKFSLPPAFVLVLTALGYVLPSSAFAESAAAKGKAIALQNDQANAGFKSDQATMFMTLINAHGDVIKREMKSWVLEGASEGDKSLIEFIAPADVKGCRMLTHTKKSGSDKQWLYLPSIKRVKRISSRNKSGSFMGSEFAYEDLGSQEVEKYTYTFIAETKLDGRDVWHVERVSVDRKSGYSKQVVWTDKTYHQALKVEYYDRRGELLKTATFGNFKQYGKFWRPNKIHMKNHQTRKESIIEWSARKLGSDIESDQFESASLADED